MNQTLPWYKSAVIIGALVSAVSKLLVLTGIVSDFSPADEQVLTNTLVLLGGGIGDLVAIVSRVRQQHAPAITAGKGLNDFRCSVFAVGAALVLLLLGGCAAVPLGDMRLKQVIVTAPSLCDAQARFLAGTANAQDLAVLGLYDTARLKLQGYFAKLTGQPAEVLADCAE